MLICKYCGSERVVKNGKLRGKQTYICKNCGHIQIKKIFGVQEERLEK